MTLENAKATAVKQQVELLKQKLRAAAHRRSASLAGAASAPVSYPVIQQAIGQEAMQVNVLSERIKQLEVALGSSTLRVHELEAALDKSVALVRKWEGPHIEDKAQVQDLEAKVAHLNALKANVEEQTARTPQFVVPKPGSVLSPTAALPRQAGTSPVKSGTSPLGSRTARMQVSSPVHGARMSSSPPRVIYGPATSASAQVVVPAAASSLTARPMQEQRNGGISIHHGQRESRHRYTSTHQPHPMLIRAVG